MGCNCGKNRNQTIAQRTRTAARERAGNPLGFDADAAVLIGEPDDVVRRVRVIQASNALRIGQAAYVTGTGVDELLTAGSMVDITKRNQARRIWKVGGFDFTNEQEAKRVAAATGQIAVEVA